MRRAARSMDAEVLRRTLASEGTATLRMSGGSMAPLLPDGTVATLRPVREGERLRGTIVAIELGGQVVVHRVALETANAIATRGIASPKFDPPVPKSAVIGIVCERSGLALSEPALNTSASALTLAVRGLRALARRPEA